MGLTVWALAGVALGYALKVKDGETRATAFGSMASALCGITEPVIYTVALTNFKRFICAFVGGGVAGVIGGILGIKFYTWGVTASSVSRHDQPRRSGYQLLGLPDLRSHLRLWFLQSAVML